MVEFLYRVAAGGATKCSTSRGGAATRPLHANIAGINRACHRRVVSSLNDRARVGEDRYLIAIHAQAQQEAVALHLARATQPLRQRGEIERRPRPVRRPHLHSIAPAERRAALIYARVQIVILAPPARGTIRLARHLDGVVGILPQIQPLQAGPQFIAATSSFSASVAAIPP